MKKTNIIMVVVAAVAAINFTSCKKDSGGAAPFVFYSVDVDGATVTFTNKSKGATEFEWDFGDGTTSKDKSPVHTYPGKGKYVPTLYATSSGGVKAEASTVLQIAKVSAIKLDDHSLSDWDTVTHNVVMGGAASGNFIKAKYDYDGNYIYVYFEQHTTVAAGNIYDLYIDADNNTTTGYLTGEIKNGAYDLLLEGSVLGDWLDPYYFIGSDQASFDNFNYQTINEFFKIGTVVEGGGVLKFEWAISRSKIKGLTSKGLKIGVQVASADWNEMLGYSPDQNADAFYLDMSE